MFLFSIANDAKVELNDVLNVDNLHSLLNKPDIQERLLPHLPPLDPESASTNDLENITANIQSSQFKTTLKVRVRYVLVSKIFLSVNSSVDETLLS